MLFVKMYCDGGVLMQVVACWLSQATVHPGRWHGRFQVSNRSQPYGKCEVDQRRTHVGAFVAPPTRHHHPRLCFELNFTS